MSDAFSLHRHSDHAMGRSQIKELGYHRTSKYSVGNFDITGEYSLGWLESF